MPFGGTASPQNAIVTIDGFKIRNLLNVVNTTFGETGVGAPHAGDIPEVCVDLREGPDRHQRVVQAAERGTVEDPLELVRDGNERLARAESKRPCLQPAASRRSQAE